MHSAFQWFPPQLLVAHNWPSALPRGWWHLKLSANGQAAAGCAPWQTSLSRRSGDRQSRHLRPASGTASRGSSSAQHLMTVRCQVLLAADGAWTIRTDRAEVLVAHATAQLASGHRARGWPAAGNPAPRRIGIRIRIRIRIIIGAGRRMAARAAGSESRSAKQPKAQLRPATDKIQGPCPSLIMLSGSGVKARQHGLEGWGVASFVVAGCAAVGSCHRRIPNAQSDGTCCRHQAATQCFTHVFWRRTSILSMGVQGQHGSLDCLGQLQGWSGQNEFQEEVAVHETHRLAARACCSP